MPLASEDRPFLRDLFHEIRDVQRETNVLLEEIRDLLKSPPVTIERRTAEDFRRTEFARELEKHLETKTCTCSESKGPCPVHEPAQEKAYMPGDTFSSRNGGRDLPKSPPGTFWYFQHEHDRYILRQAQPEDERRPAGCTCGKSFGMCPVHRK